MSSRSNNPSTSRHTVDFVSLGCSKNLVDSERLIRQLEDVGYTVRFEATPATPGHAEAVVINTCGFIGDAKQESIDTILEWADAKKSGRVDQLIVMGCLSERYRDELPDALPEVDVWRGKRDWADIVTLLARRHPGTAPFDRHITTPRHHAYLKIAEGCDRFCAFCAIPLITGRFRSRPVEELVEEATLLASRGVKELNVIAQDLSAYGKDLDGTHQLARLVDALAVVPGIRRIRLHYAYPSDFPLEVLDAMARHPNVCRYIDIALQHISDPVLRNMRRHITAAETRELLAEMRRRVPGIHIRTTLMVGFPGEGEKEFEELLDFVREQRFERMGAFAYCEEDDTYAARHLEDSIPSEVKQERLSRLMALQEEIALEHQLTKVGQRLEVVVDRRDEGYFVARSEFDSPEVDPEVLIPADAAPDLKPGDYLTVEVTEALPFELIAKPAAPTT